MSENINKFRSWVKDHYEYNVPVNSNGKYSKCVSTGFAVQYDPIYQEFDVEEFTRVRDSKGNDIYEGDIVGSAGYTHQHRQEIKWDELWGQYIITLCGASYERMTYLNNDSARNLTVIGNIHEGIKTHA